MKIQVIEMRRLTQYHIIPDSDNPADDRNLYSLKPRQNDVNQERRLHNATILVLCCLHPCKETALRTAQALSLYSRSILFLRLRLRNKLLNTPSTV